MAKHRQPGFVAVTITFLAALVLTITPLPEWARYLRPDFVTMVLIYWCLAMPERIGVGIAWTMGLLVDTLTGTLLGQNALGMSVVAYLTLGLYQRIRLFPLWQQSLFVWALLVIHQTLDLWINGIIGRPNHTWKYWVPSVLGMLMWPLIFKLLRGIRRQYQLG